MSILGKYSDNYLEEEPKNQEKSAYTTPAVLRKDEDDSLKKSLVISTILHPTVAGAAWLVFFILALLGIHLAIFDRPKPKMNDIEFVLVEKEAKPINPNTPYRSDRDSRAGGHHDPTKKVSMPSPAPAKAQKPSPAPSPQPAAKKPAQQPQPKKTVAKMPTPAPVQKPAAKPAKTEAPVPKGPAKIAPPKPAPPTARPSIKPPSTPKPVAKPSSAFTVPVPKGGTKPGAYATGPISGSGKSSSAAGGGGRSTYAPTPSLAPTGGGSASGTKLAKGGGGGSGVTGNPGPGNPNGAPGIDTIREPDFGPYMRELQRRIKMNWDPPKGNESKRVVLLFKIAKDGRLLSCSVFKSSGLPSADKAAINAVQATAPFKPLPAEFKGQHIDIQFTFDYNVFGASGYN